MTNVYTLAVWGSTDSKAGWAEWFQFMKDSSKLLGSPLTHFGIKGHGLGTKDIRPVDTFQKIQSRIESSTIDWLSGYSLPNDFQTAVFDYNVHMNRSSSYVSISAKEDFASALLADPDSWKVKAMRFCSFEKGALFQMDESESPLLFVSGSSSQDSFDSLVILSELF